MLQEMMTFLKSRKKATLVLALANLAVFVVLSMMGNTESGNFLLRYGACYTPLILQGEYWRLFTAMFLHFGLTHILFNMVCLLAIGDMLETMVGTVRFLIIYILGGLAGNLVSMAWELHTGQYAVSAGASGAIFAVIGGVFVYSLKNRKNVNQEWMRRLVLMVVLMTLEGFTESGTDNAAHVGGLFAGMLLTALLTLW